MLIGLLGEAGSGKDTAGQVLVREGFYSLALADPIKIYCHWMFGWDAERLFHSSELRNQEDPRFTFPRCPVCGQTSRRAYTCPQCRTAYTPGTLSARYALQSLGDWARSLNAPAYVQFALQRTELVKRETIRQDPLFAPLKQLGVIQDRYIGYSGSPCRRVLITDVRLRNEIEGIKAAGGKVYRVRRPQRPNTTTTGIPAHNSEMEQREVRDDELDGVIMNDADLETLHRRTIEQCV